MLFSVFYHNKYVLCCSPVAEFVIFGSAKSDSQQNNLLFEIKKSQDESVMQIIATVI